MLGVQSCKHFGWSSEALGFGHPSGALEDGARGKLVMLDRILDRDISPTINLKKLPNQPTK